MAEKCIVLPSGEALKTYTKKEGLFTSSLPQRLLNNEKARKHLLGTPCSPNGQWNTSTPFSVPPSHVTSLLCAARRPTAGGISCEQSVNNIRVKDGDISSRNTNNDTRKFSAQHYIIINMTVLSSRAIAPLHCLGVLHLDEDGTYMTVAMFVFASAGGCAVPSARGFCDVMLQLATTGQKPVPAFQMNIKASKTFKVPPSQKLCCRTQCTVRGTNSISSSLKRQLRGRSEFNGVFFPPH